MTFDSRMRIGELGARWGKSLETSYFLHQHLTNHFSFIIIIAIIVQRMIYNSSRFLVSYHVHMCMYARVFKVLSFCADHVSALVVQYRVLW